MTAEQLKSLEQLNELQLNEDENMRMLEIFERKYSCEKAMDSFNTDGVEVMVHVAPMKNVLREDISNQPFTRESLLEGAPEHTEDSWQVPRLVK